MTATSRRKKPIVGLMVVGVLCGVIGMVGRASALTYQDTENVEFTFNPTMNISLSDNALVVSNLMPGSSSDSNLLTIDISTNAGYGYYLAATVGTSTQTTDLVNVENSDYTFQNLSSNVASLVNFPDNKWGYSYSTDGGTNWVSGDAGATNAGYAGLPLDNDDSGATGVKLLDVGSFVGSSSVKFKIAAKASATQASGTYTNTVNFYAVANPAPPPYMQDMTSTKLNRLLPNIGDTTTLYDNRDEQAYQIAKLADNKYWMVENLNLAGGTALDADKTDVTSAYISNFSTSNNLTKNGNTIVLPASNTSGFDNYNYSYVYNSGNKTNCGASGQNTPCYSYYSWDAATLGSGRTISTYNTDAEQSICPKGWKLPSTYNGSGAAAEATDYRKLMIGYGGSDSIQTYNSSTTPTGATMYGNIGPGTTPNFLLAGVYYYGSFYSGGSDGYYVSSTSNYDTSTANNLHFNGSSVYSASMNERFLGFSVRCLFSE